MVEGVQNTQDVLINGSENGSCSGSETSSWWIRTRSLPSSLNKRKNTLFQVKNKTKILSIYYFICLLFASENVQINYGHKEEKTLSHTCTFAKRQQKTHERD